MLTTMDEQTATLIAEALGGTAWQSGGDIWLVLVRRADGTIVAVSEDCICEYADDESLNDGAATTTIALA